MVRRDRLLTAVLFAALVLGACRPVQGLPQQEAAPPAAAQTVSVHATETAKIPTRILFIGDGPSWFLGDYFPELAASSTPATSIEDKLIWIGGAPLSLH